MKDTVFPVSAVAEEKPLLPPEAFAEPLEPFWKSEPWDDLVPEGFLSDFILMTRGVETPTKLSLWTGIWVLSSVLKREAWLQWYPSPLYPNFFVFLVGPPKIVAKSTSIRFGEKIIGHFHDHFADPVMRALKEVNLLRSRATPEALSVALAPKKINLARDNRIITVDRGSQLSMIVSELSTFLGKQKYQTGLIDRLTDLYDCKDDDDDLTISRGYNKFYDVYFTMIGATTPKHLEESIPEEAFGGGFMSRSIVVYQGESTRDFPEPRPVLDGPSIEQMQERCAWVAQESFGEYELSKDAHDAYYTWYALYKQKLMAAKEDSRMRLQFRYDLHLLKLSLILRAQEYRPGRVIELQHFEQARRILEATYETSHQSLENVGVTAPTAIRNRVRSLFAKKSRMTRRQLLLSVSPYGCSTVQLTELLEHLRQAGVIEIRRDGKVTEDVSTKGSEVYVWKKGCEI